MDDIASAEVRKTFEHHHEWDGGASLAAPTDSETRLSRKARGRRKAKKVVVTRACWARAKARQLCAPVPPQAGFACRQNTSPAYAAKTPESRNDDATKKKARCCFTAPSSACVVDAKLSSMHTFGRAAFPAEQQSSNPRHAQDEVPHLRGRVKGV